MRYLTIFLILFTGNAFSKELDIKSFFENFNMRSTRSSMGPQLRFWCGSYPAMFFDIKEEKDNRLVLSRKGDPDLLWDVTFIKGNKVAIHDRITSGTYDTNAVIQLEYIKDKNEWWDSESLKKNKLINPETNDCEKMKN